MSPSSRGRSGAAALLLAAATLVIALTLYAPDADGAFAIYDGAWYAHYAQFITGHSILPHHPLFHVLVAGLTRGLVATHVEHAGHVAVRVIAGLGGALVLLQIARLSGPGRGWVGFGFACVLFATRGFIAEAATGENLFPAFAATLLVLQCATAATPNLFRLGAAIVLAACFRQDNLLILPGVLIAVAPALPPGRRAKPLLVMLVVAGIATFGFYLACWMYARHSLNESLVSYLTRFGRTARWAGETSIATNLLLHFGSLGAAISGRFWFSPVPHTLIGAAWVVILGVSAILLRGTDPSRRYAAAVLVTIAIRIPFFAWFEPHNFEWQLLPMTLMAALGARSARGAPATGPGLRKAGAWGLATLMLVVAASHVQNTLQLRARRLAEAVDRVIAAVPPQSYYLAMDKNAMLALEMRSRPYDQLDIPHGASLDLLSGIAYEKRRTKGVPIVMVGDRFVETGMAYELLHAAEGFSAFDAVPDMPGVTMISYEGKPFAAVLDGK